MGIESEKSMHPSLLTPGREDLSPWPPIGQVDFEKINTMDETTLDKGLKERHGLETIFKKEPNSTAFLVRRSEIKRAVFSRLEGYSMEESLNSRGSENTEERLDISANNLSVVFADLLTDDCRRRISEVQSTVAREAALHAPRAGLRELEREIQNTLRALGLKELAIRDIFSLSNPPPHKPGKMGSGIFDIQFGLSYFLLRIQGNSVAECAEKLGAQEKSLGVLTVRYLSAQAKEIIKEATKGKRKRRSL